MSKFFDKAFERLIGVEGGYVFDPDDPGGETIYGVSRRAHPDWEGWYEVDALKKNGRPIEGDEILAMAKKLYDHRYWSRVHGDAVAAINFKFAYECFEAAVNVGVQPLVKWVQAAANCFVIEGSEIAVDGLYGPMTQGLVRKLIEDGDRGKTMLKSLEIIQGYHYFTLVTERPAMRKYYMGWLTNRVNL